MRFLKKGGGIVFCKNKGKKNALIFFYISDFRRVRGRIGQKVSRSLRQSN